MDLRNGPGLKRAPLPFLRHFRFQWLMLLFLLLVVGGINLSFLLHRRDLIEENERERLLAQARIVDKNLGTELRATDLALQGLIKDLPLFQGAQGRLRADHRLSLLTDALPGIRTIVMVDASGRIRLSNRPELIGREVTRRDYFLAPRTRPNPATLYVSPPFQTTLGSYLVNLSRAVVGPGGRFEGVVAAGMDPDYFETVLTSVLYAPDMRCALIHQDGLRVVSVPPRPAQTVRNFSHSGTLFSRHVASGSRETLFMGTATSTGNRRLMALRTIAVPGLHMDKVLVVTVSREQPGMLAGWRREALTEGALFAVFALASVGALFAFQRRQRLFDAESEKARVALQESAARYQTLLKSASDGIHVLDLHGRLVEANQAFYSMLGSSEEEGRHLNVRDWDPRWECEELLRVLKGQGAEPVTFESRYRRRDGRPIEVEISARGITLGGVPHLYASSRDITDRKRAERELRDSRQQMMNIIDFLPDATFVIDLQGKVIAWNKAIEEMTGVRKEQMIGQGDYAYTLPFYGERQPQLLNLLDRPDRELPGRYRNVQRRGDTVSAEVFVPCVYQGSGALVWAVGAPLCNAEGERVGAIECIRDIGEGKGPKLQFKMARRRLEPSSARSSSSL